MVSGVGGEWRKRAAEGIGGAWDQRGLRSTGVANRADWVVIYGERSGPLSTCPCGDLTRV